MKKVFLSLVFTLTLMTSCKEKTEDKMEDATEAVTEEVMTAGDSLAAKTEEAVEAGAEKVEDAAKDVKNEMK
jgi:predicted transcriptional regulator